MQADTVGRRSVRRCRCDAHCAARLSRARRRRAPCARRRGRLPPTSGSTDDTRQSTRPHAARRSPSDAGVDLGFARTVVTVRWTPSDRRVPNERRCSILTVAAASAAGVRGRASPSTRTRRDQISPPRPARSGSTPPGSQQLATALSEVTVSRRRQRAEPARFWRPQFDAARTRSAAAFPCLAAAYDTLKAVNPAIVVVGVGLSRAATTARRQKSNISTSPVRFLRGARGRVPRERTGDAADGRLQLPLRTPSSTAPFERQGYAWPNAGLADLDRIKQAIWDAFEGTPQRTFARRTLE